MTFLMLRLKHNIFFLFRDPNNQLVRICKFTTIQKKYQSKLKRALYILSIIQEVLYNNCQFVQFCIIIFLYKQEKERLDKEVAEGVGEGVNGAKENLSTLTKDLERLDTEKTDLDQRMKELHSELSDFDHVWNWN